jgi:hypothetical protein
MMVLSSAASSKHLILEGLSRRSIMPVMPPCLSASVMVSQPYWMSLEAYAGSMPLLTIFSKERIAPVCSMPAGTRRYGTRAGQTA